MQLRSIDFKPGLRLVASTHMDPPEAEWDAMVQTVRRNDVPGYRILVITDGGSPNLKQRRAIDAAMTERKIHARSGVISASPSMRALMSAVNWIARNDLRAFRPDQVQEGLWLSGADACRDHLHATGHRGPQHRAEFAAVQESPRLLIL